MLGLLGGIFHLYKNKVKHCWQKFFVEFDRNLHCLPMFQKRILGINGLRGWRREAGLSPPLKYFTDRSKAVLLVDLLCFFFCLVFAICICARLFICALWSPAGKRLTSLLSFVVSNCEFVTFPLVSWVRCGT